VGQNWWEKRVNFQWESSLEKIYYFNDNRRNNFFNVVLKTVTDMQIKDSSGKVIRKNKINNP